ncbi:hypothetical protein WR25_23960 [Diploscapter pachys]|uniref:Uncharacterized protein n=1 Tax=Diploscapter pachys TaxID=2018661 RepID=A0A2A2LAE5_9BILA|nr:hypothetical protein WR25_23960 [Diploscapter pachys]
MDERVEGHWTEAAETHFLWESEKTEPASHDISKRVPSTHFTPEDSSLPLPSSPEDSPLPLPSSPEDSTSHPRLEGQSQASIAQLYTRPKGQSITWGRALEQDRN